jgi:Putative Ig domain
MQPVRFIFVLVVFILTACSKNEGFAPSLTSPINSIYAPGNITYSNSSPAYVLNSTITDNTPTVVGGNSVESWEIAPSLSAATGLVFDTTTGVISGIASIESNPGTTYTVTASNAYGTSTVQITIVISIAGVAPTISYPGAYTYQAGQTLGSPITPILGGGTPTNCTSSPALPTGLVLNPTTCTITGTPISTVAQQLFTITASNSTGSHSGTLNLGVLAVGPNNIAIFGVPTLNTSMCAMFILTTRDIFGNPTQVSANTTFNLSGAGTNGAFYSDADCSSTTTSLVVANGFSNQGFYYRKTSMGSATLSAALTTPASPALGSATQIVTVGASTPAKYGLTLASTGTTVSCNSVVINVLDASNNIVNATSALTVNLTGTASAQFFSNSTCTTAVTNMPIAAGSNAITAYIRKTSVGTSTVTASSTGMAPGSAAITISLAAPQRIVFSSVAAIPFPSATCQAYTLQSRDAVNANVSNVTTDTTVNLSSTGDGSFYSNSTCTLGNLITSTTLTSGTSTKVIYYSKPTSGNGIVLTASVAGWTPEATTSVNVSTGDKINIGSAYTAVGIAVSTATAVTVANKCLLTAIRVQDELGALVPTSKVTSPITVNLSGGGSGARFFSNSGCTTPITSVTVNAGSNTANFYFSSTAVTPTTPITWSNGGLGGIGGSRNVTVSSGVPSRLTWTTQPSAFNINTCQTYTFNVRDPNTVTAIGANVSSATDFNLGDGSDGIFYSTAGCSNAITSLTVASNAQVGTFYYRKTTASTATISVDLQSPVSPAISNLTRTITVALPAPVPNNISISATPATGLIATQSCSLLTLTSRNGTTAANVTANLAVTLAGTNGASFYWDSGCTVEAAPATLTILNATSSVNGLYVKTANTGSVTLSGTSLITVNTLALTYGAPPPTLLAVTGAVLMNAGSSCGSYTVTTQDNAGVNRNVSTATPVALTSTGAVAVEFYSNSTCTTSLPSSQVTISSGSSSATFYVRGNTAGNAQIQASRSGLTSGTYSVVIQ